MLDVILSSWVMAFYLPAVVVLFVLFVIYRDTSVIVYRKLRRLPAGTRTLMAAGWRLRPRLRYRRSVEASLARSVSDGSGKPVAGA